jgi:hypothetical protein
LADSLNQIAELSPLLHLTLHSASAVLCLGFAHSRIDISPLSNSDQETLDSTLADPPIHFGRFSNGNRETLKLKWEDPQIEFGRPANRHRQAPESKWADYRIEISRL